MNLHLAVYLVDVTVYHTGTSGNQALHATGATSTGKGVLSEHEHFPSGASGQSSLEYKCAYLCTSIRKSSQDYDSIKILIKISCILPITHGNCNQSGPVLGGLTI